MPEKDNKKDNNRRVIGEGYRPVKRGDQPSKGNLDTSNPPGGGDSGGDSSSESNSDSNQSTSESDDS